MELKDWVGNGRTMVCLGAHIYSNHQREKHDYYATSPQAITKLLEKENFVNVWECACGEGHLAKVLESNNILGKASDLIDRGYGIGGLDFLEAKEKWNGDIITNPPYKFAKDFILKALDLVSDNSKIAMFLRVQFMESKGRYELFTSLPPKIVYVFSSRVNCALNGEFGKYSQNAVPYAWYIWEKGFKGNTILKWIL